MTLTLNSCCQARQLWPRVRSSSWASPPSWPPRGSRLTRLAPPPPSGCSVTRCGECTGTRNEKQTIRFQLGIAVGFVLPAVLVADQDVEANYHLIGHDLFVMFLGVAIFTTILLVSIIFGEFPIPVQIYFLASLSKTFFCQISCLKYFLTFSSLITQFLPVWISINAQNNWKNFPLSSL